MKFYTDVLGWEFHKFEMENAPPDMEYWLITTGPDSEPGINGGMSKRRGPTAPAPGSYGMLTMSVSDLEAYVRKVLDAGGQVPEPLMPIPGVGRMAMCLDTEGNSFGIIQMDQPM
jgi:hypothetical protein